MSHTVQVNMIADQEISINGIEINIHDIKTIYVDSNGKIYDVFCFEKSENVKLKTEELFDADPNCDHEEDVTCMSGIRCKKCGGWFCY